MILIIVPVRNLPNQEFTTTLNNQQVRLRIYERRFRSHIPNDHRIYIDVILNNILLIAGAMCQHAVPIIQDITLGFTGDLAFVDTEGTDDPKSSGLGTRWLLVYQ